MNGSIPRSDYVKFQVPLGLHVRMCLPGQLKPSIAIHIGPEVETRARKFQKLSCYQPRFLVSQY